MQKILFSVLVSLTLSTQAQIPEDALRYSFYPQNGTARNLAIGGAMGSLGGDLNAAFVNPAGLGFYKTGEFVLSPSYLLNNNKINYRDAVTQNQFNHFNIGTIGFVLGYDNIYKPGVNNALSFAVTQAANFNNRIEYKGLNNYSSFSEQFTEEFAKSGFTIDDALNTNSQFPFTSAPALYTFLIDTVTVDGITQVKGAPEYILDAGQALMQEIDQVTSGGITELAVSFAHNKNGKWLFGGTLGVPITNYKSSSTFRESDTSGNTSNNFKQFEYTDIFTTKGVGINAKLGAIYRPKDFVRLGIAVHTPTVSAMRDTRVATLSTQLENPIENFYVSSTTFTNGQPGQSNYLQTTPWKFIASGSYVFREVENTKNQKGFISADIEYISHKGSRFSSDTEQSTNEDDAYYKSLNNVVRNQYKGNFNFRAGGELKFNIIMARLGFAYYGNPYKDPATKASRMLLSGGLGYRNKGIFFDLTYVHALTKDVIFPYRLEDRDNTFATLNQQRGNIAATIGFKF
ncbi:MAG: hypothetical protein IPJ81_04950 [Chitinophagaceae bacterium]|nr:hypothetical protein [Chitinophagaceae bacterium]